MNYSLEHQALQLVVACSTKSGVSDEKLDERGSRLGELYLEVCNVDHPQGGFFR